jgi:hypothetical protein
MYLRTVSGAIDAAEGHLDAAQRAREVAVVLLELEGVVV